MVRAQQRGDHDGDLRGDDAEDDGVPVLEDVALELEVRALAAGQHAARIARLADRRLDERVEVAAALKLVLNAQTAAQAEVAGPLGVDLALEVERALLVSDVAGRDEQREADPEEERVPGEESAVVEDDAGPADEGGEDAKRGSGGADDELGSVTDTDDVCMVPDVEPNE